MKIPKEMTKEIMVAVLGKELYEAMKEAPGYSNPLEGRQVLRLETAIWDKISELTLENIVLKKLLKEATHD